MRDFGGSMKREDYDGVFKALGDEHRLRILRLLAKKELSAGEILESMDIVQSTLSHHMKVLTDNGVVTATRSGKWTIYSVNRPVLQDAAERLEAFLSEAEHAEKSDIAIRARATVAEERVQEEKKKILISEEVRGAESAVGPVAGMREQTAGAHEPSGKKKGKKGKKSKKGGKK